MKIPEIFTKIVSLFRQQPDINKMGFLSTFFTAGADAFTDADTINLDMVYVGEEVAPTVYDLASGTVTIVEDIFSNKEIPFPVYAIDSPVSVHQLMKRRPGESAIVTEKVNWLGRLVRILVPMFARMTSMIRRSMELQAAQILQTGKITLTDINGNKTFDLDLGAKPSHFPVPAIYWGSAGYNPLADMTALADVIRIDGQCDVVNFIFDPISWGDFIRHTDVKERVKTDGLQLGALDPKIIGKGAKRMGWIDEGAYRFDLYLYDGRYQEFKSKEYKKYLKDGVVIALPATSDLDFRRYFGGIPTVLSDPVSEELFGGSIQIEGEYDFRPRIYADTKRETYIGEIKSRPLFLPASIHRFGCLYTRGK